jgi:hypothetical protein
MSGINLLLDEENELSFQLNIEGSQPGSTICRLAIDSPEIGLLFEAKGSRHGEVSVILPPLKHVLKEGEYDMTLEVIIDDKFFTPLTIKGNFEKSVNVTAEAVVRNKRSTPAVTSATLLESPNRKPSPVKEQSETSRKRPGRRKKTLNATSDDDIMKLISALTKAKKS